MFEKFADFIMKNAKLIVTIWIVVLLISVPFIIKSNSVLQYDMGKMKTSTPLESQQGQEILSSQEFNSGAGIGGGTIILIEANDNLAATIAPEIRKNLENNIYFWGHNEDQRAKYGIDYEITIKQLGRFDDKYFADKDTQMIVYTVNYPDLPGVENPKNSDYVPDIRNIVKDSISGIDGITKTYVTGTDAISYDTSTGFTKDIKHIDPISVLLVLILIGLFFRSFVAAGTPPVIIGMAYGILLAIVYAIGSVLGIYYITTILVLVSMLGAGCDYCIFIVSRYREERKDGRSHQEALRESIVWAGESIITSGLSVIIGFGSLMLCSFSLVSTMGMVLAIGIVLALLAALTFIPSLLMLVGDKIFWPSKVSTYKDGSKAMNGWYGKCARLGFRYFTHSAKSAIKYAKAIFVVTILISVPLVYVAVTSNPSYDMIGAMPDGEAKDGVSIISENIGGGLLMPTNISMKVDAFVDLNVDSEMDSGDVIPVGSNVTLEATPRTGYTVQGWIVSDRDDEDYYTGDVPGIVDMSDDKLECTVLNIDKSKTITVVYTKATYTVTYQSDDPALGSVSATSNGSLLISGMDVNFGSELKFKATPADGQRLSCWTIDRGSGDPEIAYPDDRNDNELSIDRASYDYTVTAFFVSSTDEKVTVHSSILDGHGSMVIRADGAEVSDGDSIGKYSHIVVSAIPEQGYRVAKWIINGVDDPRTAAKIDLGVVDSNTTITVRFEPIPVEQCLVVYATEGDGTLKVTSNGTEIASNTEVNSRSKVVFTATPADGKIVKGWKYTINIGGTDYYVISYVSKTEHVITSIATDENITVIFGDPDADTITVTANDDTAGHGVTYILQDGKNVASGTFPKGADLFFTAKVEEGYHIVNWTVGGDVIKTSSKNLSLYNLVADTTVSFTTAEDKYIPVFFGANDGTLGDLRVSNDHTSIAYSERANANTVYNKINDFAQSMMSMETDGKKNVAMAIGPINGDVLFDGEHEWVFDTVWNILPQEYKNFGYGETYDALVYTWNNVLTYELKQTLNYYLTYKLGFVSDVFTDKDSGAEYQYVKIMVVSKEEPMSALSVDTIKQVSERKNAFLEENSAEKGGFVHAAYISGAAVSNYEMSELVNKDFRFIIFVVVGLLIILLFLVMNSYLTPIRAVLTIVMSVMWTMGLTFILFEHILGLPVVWIVPIVLFVVCLGLGMDYDILLTTRIKEFVSKGHSNDEAITEAVQKSGAVITLCGLIMAGAFGTMMLSSSPMLKEFGFALGFAIAVDALIIRTYIVPAIMHLMGDWNWKGPNLGMIRERVIKRISEKESDE